jgi:glutathione S-transferase
MLIIWGRANSVNVQKVLWCCAELQIPHQRIDAGRGFLDTNTEEYRKLNPNKLIPTIVDGDFVLWESNVIVRYLAASYGDNAFYPEDLQTRFHCEQWMDWNATTLWPAIRPIFQLLIRTVPEERDLSSLDTLRNQADATMRVLDQHLSRSPKVLQHFSEPEVFGGHARLATCLLRRQRQHPGCGIGG